MIFIKIYNLQYFVNVVVSVWKSICNLTKTKHFEMNSQNNQLDSDEDSFQKKIINENNFDFTLENLFHLE